MLKKSIATKLEKGVTMVEYGLFVARNKFNSITSIKSQKGVTMIEYALLAALVAVAAVLTLTTLGSTISAYFTTITGKIK